MAIVTVLVCQHDGYFLKALYDEKGCELEIDKRYLGTECQSNAECAHHKIHIDDLPEALWAEDEYCVPCPRREAYCNEEYAWYDYNFKQPPSTAEDAQNYIRDKFKKHESWACKDPITLALIEKKWSVWTLHSDTYHAASYILHKQEIVEIERLWRQWLSKKMISVSNPDQNFLKFCKTYISRHQS